VVSSRQDPYHVSRIKRREAAAGFLASVLPAGETFRAVASEYIKERAGVTIGVRAIPDQRFLRVFGEEQRGLAVG